MEEYLRDIIKVADQLEVDILDLTRDDYVERGIYSPHVFYRIMEKESIGKPGFSTAKEMAASLNWTEESKTNTTSNADDFENNVIKVSPDSKKMKRWTEEAVKKVLGILSEIESTLPKIPSIYKKATNGTTAALQINDIHTGKLVRRGGAIVYDEHIMQQRFDIVFERFIENLEKSIDVDEIVLLLAGDLADGSQIYKTQLYNQSVKEVPDQVEMFVEMLWKWLVTLKDRFPHIPIRLECVVGNHGIVPDSIDNWDYVIYQMLSICERRSNKGFIVNYSKGNFHSCEIKGHKYLLKHKAPKQVETAAGSDKYGGWLASFDYDVFITAHWHNPALFEYCSKQIIRGPSLCGPDDLSDELAKMSVPGQQFWKVDKHNKFFDYTRIEV